MSAAEVSGKCPEVFQRHAEAGRMSQAFFPLRSGTVRRIEVSEVIAFDQHTAFVPECCTYDHSPCCGTFVSHVLTKMSGCHRGNSEQEWLK